ncbi:autotransporter outer membrane beta-barrel domain-containing protein [Lichenifustis flavocetrariae]|uniref:Autotransporter outer membrane beta-barrel domain-containing protein n=1 Tax=Lichenifustis flavocetrariae TaxID=2949735 RepID=A0AA41YVH9_9HYPH|nr:autotransporter outer membrane beta-barrel domain-containing protein [Lichenifustis flavocetrariae]MCW6508874.1 autotransporter outer membrane beta-barrel domain-containing protein [Lichenifustis flavocetrariae]
MRDRRIAARRSAPPAPPQVALPAPGIYPVPIYESRYGAWAQGFGNVEDRSAVGRTSINCCTALPGFAAGIPIGLTITEKSHADTYGFLGGIDYTARSLARPGDGLILGVLVGYTESDFRIKSSTTSSLVANVGNGAGTVLANLSGASTGAYATYFSGPFTADLTFKADIFDLNESFADQLAFTVNVDNAGNLVAPGVNAFSGTGSGGLTNLSTFGNLSYRLDAFGPIWIEPTVGFQYTASLFDGRAKRELGLDNGDLLMVQGGARVGTDTILANQSRLSTSLTGLVFSDVIVDGGFIQGGFFGTNLLAKSDEGKVRGRGILAVNYDVGNGVNLFAQGDVYGGDRLFGAGGKGGLRVQW